MRDPQEKVVVAYLHPGEYSAGFGESIVDLMMFDSSQHRRIVDGGGRLSYKSSANLSDPRNKICTKFLEHGADWLFMVDSDMVFKPDVVERLLEYADPDRAPIVGGLCFGFDEEGDVQPTLFGLQEDEAHPGDLTKLRVIRYREWTPDAMYQVAATGAAALLIHRSALLKIKALNDNPVYPWFQEQAHNGQVVGEDITFCWRAIKAGLPVYVNTAVQLGHIKERVLTMESYFLSRGLLNATHQGATS